MSDVNKLRNNLRELDGDHEVPLRELFTDKFTASVSDFATTGELLTASGLQTVNDLATEDNRLAFARNTVMKDWDQLFSSASEQWILRRLQA
jgi:hypothetical protein